MVGLPKYVHADVKANGRRYLSYQRFRGTPRAWPRVPLPADPLSHEFVARAKLCESFEATKGADGWTWRFIDLTGRRHELPAPDEADAFWTAVEKAERIGKELAAGQRKTFSALIIEFKASNAYQLKGESESGRGLAEATRDQYERHLVDIEAAWGDDPVASLTAVDAQRAIDAFKDTPSAGRIFRAVLSRLIGWGIPRGYSETNPVENTEKPEEGGTYDPWPPWAFEHFFANARIDLHLPVYSALFTGQRKSDVMKMLRPTDGATDMPLIAQKTGEFVPVQIHSEYREAIEAARPPQKDGEEIPSRLLHLRTDGQPWTYEGIKTAWQREMNRDEFKRFREHRLVFHGLRKNAVNMLLEVGCSEERVGAIVGMSAAMVHHYSRKVNKVRLARDAMRQLEAGWSALRPNVLGTLRRIK